MPLRPLIALTLAAPCCAGSSFDNWRPLRDASLQDYGYQWAAIGHARNADWVGLQPPFGPVVHVGGVDYRYRIARTEVTNRQWFEFVQAYAPFVSAQYDTSQQFIGRGIGVTGTGGYSLAAGTADWGATVGWRFAARYVNWLHNGKVNEQWAFESGVYDTSTFGDLPGSQITDQRERSQGARYFLPTLDEWIKAAHFDPDRYGQGQEGYWLYATTSDTAPVAGAPGTPGAQTNAGTLFAYPIMSYPDVQTPWGLWDVSGSVREWTETITPGATGRRAESTDLTFLPPGFTYDHIGLWSSGSSSTLIGIRIASIIPAPSTMLITLIALAPLTSRRRTPTP